MQSRTTSKYWKNRPRSVSFEISFPPVLSPREHLYLITTHKENTMVTLLSLCVSFLPNLPLLHLLEGELPWHRDFQLWGKK